MILRLLSVTIFSLCALVGGSFVYLVNHDLGSIGIQRSYEYHKPSIVLDSEEKEFARFELDRRSYTTFDQIPKILVQAFVAAEDHAFFSHIGLSFKGIIRSFLVNLYHRRVVQGASTITQQVARLIFLSQERTFLRKFRELIVALQIERSYSKEYIFELYLNNVYFGRGIYGVDAACQRFWKKSVQDITLDEAAILAAVAKSARFYSPLNAPLTAKKRRNTILNSMKKLLFITDSAYQEAIQLPLVLADHLTGNGMTLYIQEAVRIWAESKWGREAVYGKGLIIKTTIDQSMQAAAEKAFKPIVESLRGKVGNSLNGGMVCLQTQTGGIKALVGGLDFHESQFNRALHATRQVGSSFKPILYSAALCAGFEMDEVMVDEPLNLSQPNGQSWTPRNWTNTFEGAMTLVRALTFSNNIITIKVLLELGAERVARFAQRFGLKQLLKPYPSLALGTAEMTVADNAAAFNVFANNGFYVAPTLVAWVKDNEGHKIWEHQQIRRQALNPTINTKMINALSHRMELSKKYTSFEGINAESIGKSGSTNGAASVWFVGSTPDYTTAVYLGNDTNKPLGKSVYASKTAFPIWLNFYKNIHHKNQHFYNDPSLVPWKINWLTGQPATIDDNPLNVVTILRERIVD